MAATLTILFWLLVGVVVYTYIAYPVLIAAIAWLKRGKEQPQLPDNLPHVTLFVTAFNEERFVDEKIANTHALDYPSDRLHLIWVTDGSDDQTNQMLAKYKVDEDCFFKSIGGLAYGKYSFVLKQSNKAGETILETDQLFFTISSGQKGKPLVII